MAVSSMCVRTGWESKRAAWLGAGAYKAVYNTDLHINRNTIRNSALYAKIPYYVVLYMQSVPGGGSKHMK